MSIHVPGGVVVGVGDRGKGLGDYQPAGGLHASQGTFSSFILLSLYIILLPYYLHFIPWPQGYKYFFLFNSAEHEIYASH